MMDDLILPGKLSLSMVKGSAACLLQERINAKWLCLCESRDLEAVENAWERLQITTGRKQKKIKSPKTNIDFKSVLTRQAVPIMQVWKQGPQHWLFVNSVKALTILDKAKFARDAAMCQVQKLRGTYVGEVKKYHYICLSVFRLLRRLFFRQIAF